MREPLARAWRERRGRWERRCEQLADAARGQVLTQADEGRRKFALELPSTAVGALCALITAEKLRGDSAQFRGDALSHRVAADLSAAIAASEPLPEPEGPLVVEPPFSYRFVPHGSDVRFHVPEQAGSTVETSGGYKFTPFAEGQAPPKKPNELPRG
jgi:hypothetical protein